MTEKELAEKICNECAKSIVDELGTWTMGGASLGEEYARRCYRKGGYDVREVSKRQAALAHWVVSVGYSNDEEFQVIMSDHIQNC